MTVTVKAFLTFILLSQIQLAKANDIDPDSVWQQLKIEHFGQRIINENASNILFIEVPNKVEDAAMMPITIKSLSAQTPQHHIKTLHLIVDNNPQPYSAAFHLSPTLGAITLSTRIRMDSFSNVRVIAEMNDDSLYMVNHFVIASGGCSSPASKDSAASKTRLGKIQIRMRKPTVGHVTTTHVIVSHPNASGMQFDQKSRHFIPAHYVTNMAINFNNNPLITAEMGITISENPSIRFNFTPEESGILKAEIIDSQQSTFVTEKQIN